MLLKKHLNFTGDRATREIRFHDNDDLSKDIVVEADDFDKIWDYLTILSKPYSQEDVLRWKNKYHVQNEEKSELDAFLVANGMVYLSQLPVKNTRLANFLGNWKASNKYGSSNILFQNKTALVLGVGTVGSSLIDYLMQFDVQNYILVDGDTVASGNIPHQRNYANEDIGKYKCDIAKKHILECLPSAHVQIFKTFLQNFNDFQKCIEDHKPDVVFWAMDQYNGNLIEEIYKWSKEQHVPAYMSGYAVGGYVIGKPLTYQFVNDLKEFKESKCLLCDNSGIGILGDISAMFMIRLWLQDIDERFNAGIDALDYNFCYPNESNVNKIRFNAKEEIKKLSNQSSEETRSYQKDNIIFPYFLLEYVEHSADNTENSLADFYEQHGLDFFEAESKHKEQYRQLIQNTVVTCNGEAVSIPEFSSRIANGKAVSNLEKENCKQAILRIASTAERLFAEKKKMYFSDYKTQWEEKRLVKSALNKISKDFYGTAKNSPAFLDGHNHSKSMSSIKDQIKIIKEINACNDFFDLYGFVDFLMAHNGLHFSKSLSKRECVYNPRYGTSDVIVPNDLEQSNVFILAHEIGHAYYNSYLPKGFTLKDNFSEFCALLTEFQLMRLLERKYNAQWRSLIIDRLKKVFLGTFSVDLYEEKALNCGHLSFDAMKEIEIDTAKELLGTNHTENWSNEYECNFLYNEELITSMRTPYLYPEAMMNAIDLGFRIEADPFIQRKLIKYISNVSGKQSIGIKDFYTTLGIEMNPQFYEEASCTVSNWITALVKGEQKS